MRIADYAFVIEKFDQPSQKQTGLMNSGPTILPRVELTKQVVAAALTVAVPVQTQVALEEHKVAVVAALNLLLICELQQLMQEGLPEYSLLEKKLSLEIDTSAHPALHPDDSIQSCQARLWPSLE